MKIKKSSEGRVHIKSAKDMKEFLINNQRDFFIERTSTGFPTIKYNNITYYVRDKVMQRAFLNKILNFHNDVASSKIFNFIDSFDEDEIQKESDEIERSLLYKGFNVDGIDTKNIQGVIKIDLNSAYWQTCKILKCIKSKTYKDIIENCSKGSRLKLTGTLGKKILVSEYKKGKKIRVYPKKLPKRRIVFQNIYNRIRKYVDELMIHCIDVNPDNFIGFYVDCLWLREYDEYVINKLSNLYNIKIEIVDLEFIKNNHGKMNIVELSKDGLTRYDGNYIPEEFVMYKKFYNFTKKIKDFSLV